MGASTFRSKLFRPEGVGTWTFALIPAEVTRREAFRPRQRVKGTVNGTPFKSSLMPRGGGTLFVVVNQEVREAIGKKDGDAVEFSLSLDTAPVVVTVPPALAGALRADSKAKKAFEALAPSHRKAFALWVGSAKQPETRDRRVAKAIALLRAGKPL